MKVNCLGVGIDDITASEAVETVEGWIKNGGKHYIVTPNPEFLVAAQKDSEFKEILNKANLSVPDGAGLKLSGQVENKVAGVDLMEELVAMCAAKGFSVGLLGGRDGVAQKSAAVLKQRYPDLKISFATEGGEVYTDHGSETSISVGIIPPTDIIFVAFGHGKQEKWIYENLPKIQVKVAMGVGGAFDYISGKVFRAPKILRDLGLEWLFRLIVQPWRIKRQLALIKYLYLIGTSR